ncbi:MAG: 50S ribosomal protein L13, partial [Candidatus Aenigmatarchaeota archaeon]
VDAKDSVLGRLASRIAKNLLEEEKVTVVNSEKAVISGREKSTLSEYDAWTKIKSLVDPSEGPIHPTRPGDLLRRTVRGMLPFKKPKGREAYDRLQAYAGVPAEYEGEEFEKFPKAQVENLNTRRFIRIGELSKQLSGKD